VPSPSSSPARLTGAEIRSRFEGLTSFLWRWGDVTARDSGAKTRARLLEFRVEAPGEGLPPDVVALYREYYAATTGRVWELAKYTYEYLDLRRGWRLAYHLHDVGGLRRAPHAHCGAATSLPDGPSGAEPSEHLRSIEYDLREAHRAFMRLYAADVAPDCEHFLPLAVSRGQ
jgi:hypothetical protein